MVLGEAGVELLQDLRHAVEEGVSGQQIRTRPHLLLMQPLFYASHLRPLLARWAVMWLRHAAVGMDHSRVSLPLLPGAVSATSELQSQDHRYVLYAHPSPFF